MSLDPCIDCCRFIFSEQLVAIVVFLSECVSYHIIQGHPTDRFGKVSVRKALNPLQFSKGIQFTSNVRDMGILRPSVFGLIKNWFRVPKKGQLRVSERK